MNKIDQLKKAIAKHISAAEPRRAMLWKYCDDCQKAAAQEQADSAEALKYKLASAFFADAALNVEARTACACYLDYTEIFKSVTREKSAKLQPIRDALRAAGYSFDYDATEYRRELYKVYNVGYSFSVGDYGSGEDWRNRELSGEHLKKQLERLQKEANAKSPSEIISDAENAARAWLMLEAQKTSYAKNLAVLRSMVRPVSFADWGNRWKVSGY